MVQGKQMHEFITFYIEPQLLKALPFSNPHGDVNFTARIGIDESGKGDFFGPLCIAGVQANEEQIKQLLTWGVRDSKKITDAVAIKLAGQIKSLCPVSTVMISPRKYNELYGKFHNLNRLLGWGHATAIAELVEKTGCKEIIIDQFAAEHIVEQALKSKQVVASLIQRHRAEEDPVVAAASIVARAAFLNALKGLGDSYGVTLPKGASQAVLQTGKTLVAKHGPQILNEVAKIHFKTTQEILA
jgi:ribonuclease HIII